MDADFRFSGLHQFDLQCERESWVIQGRGHLLQERYVIW